MNAIDLLKLQHREVDVLFMRASKAALDEKVGLLGQIAEKLTLHTRIEEQHLYPFARRMGIQDLVDHSLKEHMEAKRLIANLLQCKRSDPKLNQELAQLQQTVRQHVKEEEEKLFPRLSELASAEDLEQLGGTLQQSADELANQELLTMAENEGSALPPVQS
ncbi:hemerythrin domain-containing protein [Pyxidicoccus trucidator]|uniref:hemerythrin domain-containing protein n=1 Tax=Pyxidicoccus trucidator TaxID=2709662 RepID=UPI0013DBCDBA|nr:hemerythrin domain-containing protein [Pyxidicoccus trucidator]